MVIDGQGDAALAPGGGADEALASLILLIAAVDAGLALFVLVVGRARGRARFIHGLSSLFSAVVLVFLVHRIGIDEHQTFLARMDPGGGDSHLGAGIYLVCIGLAVCAAAPLVALPEIRRAMKT